MLACKADEHAKLIVFHLKVVGQVDSVALCLRLQRIELCLAIVRVGALDHENDGKVIQCAPDLIDQ